MDIFLNAGILSAPFFPRIVAVNRKPVKSRTSHCLGKNGENSGLSRGPFKMELEGNDNMEISQEMQQSVNSELEKKNNDIWRLFREAQQNILYLNKQRLMALEGLDKMKEEKNLLLDRIEQLEVKRQANFGKDKLSISWELLLRIDSMVLTGMIGTGEASDLRRLVMDSKISVADDFSDILHKKDAELLAELRNFSNRSKRKAFHIVHICTEMAPVISVGSLASYVTGLSHALQKKGNLVEVILPK